MVRIDRYPLAAIMARAMPVLPEVGSTRIVLAGLIGPLPHGFDHVHPNPVLHGSCSLKLLALAEFGRPPSLGGIRWRRTKTAQLTVMVLEGMS
jgi:hypothetical protein